MVENLASRVRSARERRGWNLQQLSDAANVDKSILSRIEAGEREDVRLSTAVSICRALGIRLDDFAGVSDGAPSRIRHELVDVAEVLEQAADRLRRLPSE